jgi:hypothetical protein
MAIDKSLYEAPMGLGALDEEEPLDIEILLPEDADVEIGVEVEEEEGFDDNLAEYMSEGDLQSISADLLGDIDGDIDARKEWLTTYVDGLKLLGLKNEERMEPWAGACGVTHPLLMEAAVKFQSETIMETFPAAGPVRTKIIGKETVDKMEAAQRVQEDMNYRLTEQMLEYRPDHERMLISLCLSGNAFKKIYYDPSMERQIAVFIPAEDIIVPFGASSLESAERVTHRMRKTKNELRKLQVAGFYLDVDLGEPTNTLDEVEKRKATEQGFSATSDDRFQLLEIHADLDLPGYEDEDGIALPYVVTIEKGTSTVLSIRRNWLEEDPLKIKRQHFVHYGYIPGFGFYYFGLIHLIGGHSKAATSLLRQLVDAGTLSNLPGGLKSRGLRVKGDDTPIAPGEFRDVDLPSGAIRDNILPLPYKEPSQVLVGLMDKIIDEGRQFAAAADLQISDMSAQAPVGTTLAVLERTLKIMSAIQARIHYAMKQEFKLLAAIIRDNMPTAYDYEPETGDPGAKQSDYDQVDILPVSDPNASTMAQRVVQYQAVMQLAQGAPQIYNLPVLHRQMIEILGVKNADKIVPQKDDMKPMDPVSENMAMFMGKPTKAFMYQDHTAHIGVHMAAMQDPKMAALMGQNPNAQGIQAAFSAHLMEHMAYQYRKDIEKQLGASLPSPPDFLGEDEDVGYLTPEVEVQVSQLAAEAADRLLKKDMAEAQMQQAQEQMQDPLVQMQQMDLQIKKQLADIEGQKVQLDHNIKLAQLDLQKQKMTTDALAKSDEIDLKEKQQMIDALHKSDQTDLAHEKHGSDMAHKYAKHRTDNVRMGMDAAHKARTLNKPQPPKAAPPKGNE